MRVVSAFRPSSPGAGFAPRASAIRSLRSTPLNSGPRARSGLEVLGGEVDRDDGWHMVIVDGEPRVGAQHAPDHVAPDWPDGSPPQQSTSTLERRARLGCRIRSWRRSPSRDRARCVGRVRSRRRSPSLRDLARGGPRCRSRAPPALTPRPEPPGRLNGRRREQNGGAQRPRGAKRRVDRCGQLHPRTRASVAPERPPEGAERRRTAPTRSEATSGRRGTRTPDICLVRAAKTVRQRSRLYVKIHVYLV